LGSGEGHGRHRETWMRVLKNPPAQGGWNGRKVDAGTGEALPGLGTAVREETVRITDNGKSHRAGRESEGVIVATTARTTQPGQSEAPLLHRCRCGKGGVGECSMRARSTGLESTRALQRVLYRTAKQQPDRRFHALFDKVVRSDVLARAWSEVRANKGAPGVDGVSISDVEASGVDAFLQDIAASLRDRTYRPAPLRRVNIPKAGKPGRTRPLSIPTVRDRTVMTAAKIVLEAVFEADFRPASFGFRPKRSAHQALEVIRIEANRGRDWVLDADLTDCFGSISHEALRAQLARRVFDKEMLKLVSAWLKQGVLEAGAVTDPVSGTPQGSPISPLLCNVALNVLDEAWEQQGRRIGVLVRYSDDFVILCASKARAEEARRRVEALLFALGVQLNPEKTRMVHLSRGKQGFDFLGFHLHKVESWRWRGKWYLQRWPSRATMVSLRARIKAKTDPSQVGRSLDDVVGSLNPLLRGWHGYFRYGNSSQAFARINEYVHLRLATYMSRKHGRKGLSWTGRYDYAWLQTTGIYRLRGTARPEAVHALR
jgi:RNA-directed DNA polymerase